METIPIENRKLFILENAKKVNDYVDCDVIQMGITELEKENKLEQIIYKAMDLKNYIISRTGETKNTNFIEQMINELSSIHIQKLSLGI